MKRNRLYDIVCVLWKLKAATLGGIILLALIFSAIFPSLLSPHDPFSQDVTKRLLPPFWMEGGEMSFPLGTDQLGRDTLSRVILGSRISLSIGALAVILAASFGVTIGIVSGYYGKFMDSASNMLVNIMLAFPFMLLALAIIAVLGPSFKNMIIVLGLTGWPMYMRPIRSEVLNIRQQEFILAAKGSGMSDLRIMFLHILPNLTNSIIVIASLEVARMIILESFLSFLGLGVQPPTPSWGGMLGDGRVYMLRQWWLSAFPGFFIFAATLSINFVGEGLRDILDPRF